MNSHYIMLLSLSLALSLHVGCYIKGVGVILYTKPLQKEQRDLLNNEINSPSIPLSLSSSLNKIGRCWKDFFNGTKIFFHSKKLQNHSYLSLPKISAGKWVVIRTFLCDENKEVRPLGQFIL